MREGRGPASPGRVAPHSVAVGVNADGVGKTARVFSPGQVFLPDRFPNPMPGFKTALDEGRTGARPQ